MTQPSRSRKAPRSSQTGRVTMTDVARAAGVSPATASHVFSGHRPVSPEARDAVLAAAARMAYTPNTTARALASGRSMVIAVYSPFDPDDLASSPFFAPIIVSISTTIAADGYAFLILPSRPAEATTNARSLIRENRIDGVIMIDPGPDDLPFAKTIVEASVPLVTMGRLTDLEGVGEVDGDVVGQFTDALDHLAERGYARPALVTFPGDQSYMIDAERAYRAWALAHGVEPILCTTGGVLDLAVHAEAIEQLVATDFDSVVCVDDTLAIHLTNDLQALGRVGIGVVGIGNSRQARDALPSLTSIDTHASDRARYAAQLVLELVSSRDPQARQVTVPHQLVVRDSTPRAETEIPRALEPEGDRHGNGI